MICLVIGLQRITSRSYAVRSTRSRVKKSLRGSFNTFRRPCRHDDRADAWIHDTVRRSRNVQFVLHAEPHMFMCSSPWLYDRKRTAVYLAHVKILSVMICGSRHSSTADVVRRMRNMIVNWERVDEIDDSFILSVTSFIWYSFLPVFGTEDRNISENGCQIVLNQESLILVTTSLCKYLVSYAWKRW